MSAASSHRSEEDFLCSICLEVFTDPVSTSCGHTFCRSCLTLHWTAGNVVSCPVCKHVFTDKPELHVNIVIKEMVSQLRREDRQQPGGGGDSGGDDSGGASASEQSAAEGGVLCDLCTGTRLKAFKSCLVCLSSYCKTHLEPHGSRSALRRHQLVEPVDNLEGRLCPRHDKPLELFCQSDQACVCMLCSILEHKNHQLVPLRDEAEAKKAELGKVEAELQQVIQRKQEKMEEIRKVVRSSKEAADEAEAEGVAVFTALVQAAQEGLKRLREDVDETRRAKEKVAEGLLEDLDQELCELLRKRSELQQLSHSEDHLHLLQSLPTLTTAAPAGWEEVEDGVSAPLYGEMVARAVARLEETVKMRIEKLRESGLRKVQQYAVDVTLDPETVNLWLHLSEDRKQVHDDNVWKELPGNPKRFMILISVLGEQSFSSGRFYFEVQVQRKTEWYLGVVVESIEREGFKDIAPENGFWVLSLENKRKYQINDSPSVNLKLQSRPKRVGVFVDYDEGLVSFYDADTAALIHSFTGCCFTEKVFPFFSPGEMHGSLNSEPLIISSLNEIGEIYELPDLFE